MTIYNLFFLFSFSFWRWAATHGLRGAMIAFCRLRLHRLHHLHHRRDVLL